MNEADVVLREAGSEARPYRVCKADLLCRYCGFYSPAEGPVPTQKYALVVCHRCGEAVMLQAENVLLPGAIIDYHPKKLPSVDPFIPKDIAEDYLEAQRCFSSGAWHGCAVMTRRCMHSVAEYFKASGKDLYEQIEDLRSKQIITPVLAEQAQRVRVLEKHGAHPYDTKGNELKDLGAEDARSALEFCNFIFDQVFVQPEKIKASKTRLNT